MKAPSQINNFFLFLLCQMHHFHHSAPAPVHIDGLPSLDGIVESLEKLKVECKKKLSADGWNEVELDPVHGSTRVWFKENGDLQMYKLEGEIEHCTPEEMRKMFWNKVICFLFFVEMT
jgi:hypothetical protein